MATYTVIGHPLNYADLNDPATPTDLGKLQGALVTHGIGTTVTVTLGATADTKAKSHKTLQ